MSRDMTSNFAMLAALIKAICTHYDMAEDELLEIMENSLLEEE